MLYQFEGYKIIAGCDEAGRGCLAGPVYAAAVILPEDVEIECINDSKQLSAKKRYQLREVIESKAITYAVASCSNVEIDEINILNASILAMHRAIDKLRQKPDTLLIDGNRFKPYKDIPHHCIVKGDATYGQIARLTGRERHARLVGLILSRAERYGEYPCHRVVNHVGRLAPHFPGQRRLLLEEGVPFRANGCVDMRRCQWDCHPG